MQGAQTIVRAIKSLKLVGQHAPRGLRLIDVINELQLEKSTAHRLLKTLVAEGLLIQDKTTKRYTLGSLVFELGLAAAHQFNLRDICSSTLQWLANVTGDTSFLFVRSGNDSVCLSRFQGNYPIQTPVVPVGSRQPLGVNAGGLALLSCLPDHQIKQIITENADALKKFENLKSYELLKLCEDTKEKGYTLTANRAVPGIRALGLPILSHNGHAIAAITVATTLERMQPERIQKILPFLEQAVRQVTDLIK